MAEAPSRDGGLEVSDPREGGRAAGVARLTGALTPRPTLLDIPPEATRLLGTAMGLLVGGFEPGPTVLASAAFRVVGLPVVICEELTLRVIVDGLAANCFGAAALSARVIRFAAGGFKPVSWSLRFAPPREAVGRGAIRWDVVKGSSGIEGTGGGPRIEGRLRTGEEAGEVVIVRRILGLFSPNGILLGDGSFES